MHSLLCAKSKHLMAVFISSTIYGFATKIVRSLVSAKVFDSECFMHYSKTPSSSWISCVLSVEQQKLALQNVAK